MRISSLNQQIREEIRELFLFFYCQGGFCQGGFCLNFARTCEFVLNVSRVFRCFLIGLFVRFSFNYGRELEVCDPRRTGYWNSFVFAAPGADDCETAFNYVKCSYKNDPDYFFFPWTQSHGGIMITQLQRGKDGTRSCDHQFFSDIRKM